MSVIDVDEILEHQLNANMLSMPYDVYLELFDSVAALGDENAKLRKLVRDMWHEGAFEAGACYVEEADRLKERTRELGIEADE